MAKPACCLAAMQPGQTLAQAQIARAKNIGPQEGENQHHLRSPRANPLIGCQRCGNLFIGKLRHLRGIQPAIRKSLGNSQNRPCLAGGQSTVPQPLAASGKDGSCCPWRYTFPDASPDCGLCQTADLLANYRMGNALKKIRQNRAPD